MPRPEDVINELHDAITALAKETADTTNGASYVEQLASAAKDLAEAAAWLKIPGQPH